VTLNLLCGGVLRSVVSTASFVVVDGCEGLEMPRVDGVPLEYGEPQRCGTSVVGREFSLRGGYRYIDGVTGLTLLCVYPGTGTLEYQARQLIPVLPGHRRMFGDAVVRDTNCVREGTLSGSVSIDALPSKVTAYSEQCTTRRG
jgi:hypothetical protein